MLTQDQHGFLETVRVAHLATADRQGVPHVVPVCFAVSGNSLYIAIDQKPKSGTATGLKRLRNIAENPAVSVVAHRYNENWSRLGWVLLHGKAEILSTGEKRDEAHSLLRARYPQYQAMDFAGLPVIAVRIARSSAWGNLSPHA